MCNAKKLKDPSVSGRKLQLLLLKRQQWKLCSVRHTKDLPSATQDVAKLVYSWGFSESLSTCMDFHFIF